MWLLWTSRLHLPEREVKYFWTVLTTPQIHPSITKYSQVIVIPIHKIYSSLFQEWQPRIPSYPGHMPRVEDYWVTDWSARWCLLMNLQEKLLVPHLFNRRAVTITEHICYLERVEWETYCKAWWAAVLTLCSTVWVLLARGSSRKLPLKDHQQPGQQCAGRRRQRWESWGIAAWA